MLTLEQSSPVFLSLPQQESSISRPGGLAPTHVKRLETLHERGSEGRQREDSDGNILSKGLTHDPFPHLCSSYLDFACCVLV